VQSPARLEAKRAARTSTHSHSRRDRTSNSAVVPLAPPGWIRHPGSPCHSIARLQVYAVRRCERKGRDGCSVHAHRQEHTRHKPLTVRPRVSACKRVATARSVATTLADGSVEHTLRVLSCHTQSVVHQASVTGTQVANVQTTRGSVHNAT